VHHERERKRWSPAGSVHYSLLLGSRSVFERVFLANCALVGGEAGGPVLGMSLVKRDRRLTAKGQPSATEERRRVHDW
jgi:hypothetical protein